MPAFDPDEYLKKKEGSTFDPDQYLAKKEKSIGEKFMEPIKSMNVEDWKKSSLSGPLLQTLGGLTGSGPEQDKMLQEGLAGVKRKGDEILQGIGNFILDPATGISNAYNAITENPAGAAGNVVKGLAYDPQFIPGAAKAAVQAPKAVINTAKNVAPVVKDVAGAVISPIQTTKNFAGGFREGYFNPEHRPLTSAMAPLEEYYFPQDAINKFKQGLISKEELETTRLPNARQDLFPTARDQSALAASSKLPGGQELIPLQGRKMEAFGEQLGREYGNKPLMGIADLIGGLGGIAATGFPVTPSLALKGYQGLATRRLGQSANFDPDFQRLYRSPGPIAPAQTPKQASMEAAASKINPTQPVAPVQPAPQAAAPIAAVEPPPQAGSAPIANETFSQQLENWKNTQGYKGPETTPKITTGPVAPVVETQLPVVTPPAGPQLTSTQQARALLDKMREQQKAGKTVEKTPKQLEREQQRDLAAAEKQFADTAIDAAMKSKPITETVPLDPSRSAYNDSNATKGKVKHLLKMGHDEMPVIPGMTETQVIEAMFKKSLSTRKNKPSNVSEMLVDPDKMWNTLKEPENITPLEKSVSQMDQTVRDQVEQLLRKQSIGVTDPTTQKLIAEHLELFDKYRIKK